MKTELEPATLQEAIVYFSDLVNCREYVVIRRWPDGVTCPRCGSKNVAFQEKYNRWQCNNRHDRRQFTLKIGTIFEDSPLGMDKWLMAMWMIANCKNGISSYELHRAIGVTQKTAWFMLHRIRLAMESGSIEKLKGHVEVDETFIGGKASNMHRGKRTALGRGTVGKAVVMGMLERGGKIKASVVENTRRHVLKGQIAEHVEKGSALYTDALRSYENLRLGMVHKFIDHAVCYAKGKVHTNGLENFWSLLKRAIRGTNVNIESFYLTRYVDEQAFRFNLRKTKDADRFKAVLQSILGKRITYRDLTGGSAA